MSEWRDVWKEAIKTCQDSILAKDYEGVKFNELRNTRDEEGNFPYKNDKMVDFVEAITYECLKDYDKAIKLYEVLSNPETGLPVDHWRKTAFSFLQRAREKKQGRIFSETFRDNFASKDLAQKDALKEIQWTAFYHLHSLAKIPHHIRYLAISSMSRIDSEPESAIVIFRTCMEGLIRKLYPEEYQKNDTDEKTLGFLLSFLFKNDKLFTKKSKKAEWNRDLCYVLKERGNDAAHGNSIKYSNSYICETIMIFMDIMQLADNIL